LLGVVYFVAFVSLWVQVEGLIGSTGILPVGEFLERARGAIGARVYWRLPTLCWIDASDGFLHALCGAGVVLALLLVAGVATRPVMVGLWVAYLSLTNAGQTFLAYQWDILLLETGFAALFLAPPTLRPRAPWNLPAPYRGGMRLLRLLLFKLMFLSGIVKLLSMDETWWNLTALDYHYYTQPLPVWTSWFAHHLPHAFHRASTLGMFAVEIGFPFLFFGPRRLRLLAAAATVALQLGIAATGNYGFFNLLTIVLCVTLLDDAAIVRFLPSRLRPPAPAAVPTIESRAGAARRLALAGRAAAVVLLGALSALALLREMSRTLPDSAAATALGRSFRLTDRALLRWSEPWLLRPLDPFYVANGYGLFRVMTTARPEIVVEGSLDGQSWRPYEFRWKPGDPSRRPRWVAPHQPRLDWQMWFAALGPEHARPWLEPFLRRLLEGAPEVAALLERTPFGDRPPRYVRLVYYDYAFTTREERRRTGEWWTRRPRGTRSRAISLDDFRGAR
jgi:hypothetical protein